MNLYDDDKEFPEHPIFSRVWGMFDGNPSFKQMVRLGLLADIDGAGEEINCADYARRYDRSSDRRFTGNHTGPTSSGYPMSYFPTTADLPRPPPVKGQAQESGTERKGTLLPETKKYKGKAERKRLKKQKQKEKKLLEKLEKEKKNPAKNEDGEVEGLEIKIEKSKQIKQQASAKDTDSSDSSEDESSDEDGDAENDSGDTEELDMSSLFVSKAADIARRKLELNSKSEKREKKSLVKEEPKTSPKKPNQSPRAEKKEQDSFATSSLSVEDNVKISTDLANTGNRFASAGDFKMAVKYFTDAIKFNPTEFKLFGNRSFCFEKMREYEKALIDAELSLSMCPGWVKGLFRKGRALAGLKRYDEASQAFREVLELDGSCAEAAQELMRVQITQLMGYGFSPEQSSNALIIHGTVQKALEVLSQLNNQPGPFQNGTLPSAQVAKVTGASSATNPAPHPAQSQNAPQTLPKNRPLVPVQNTSNVQSQPVKTSNEGRRQPQELFPVWVGNLFQPVTESDIKHLFNKAGAIYSVKLLSFKRCAFVNFTKQEYCDEAIRRFHGFDLNGFKIAVRYPDRIPQGMGISKQALRSEDLQDENIRHENDAGGWRRPFRPYRHGPDHHRGNYYD